MLFFRIHDIQLEAEFIKQAEQRQLFQLAGHSTVGGLRASLYNAMPLEGAQALAEFMKEFHKSYG